MINFDMLDEYYDVLVKDIVPNVSPNEKNAVKSAAAAMIILRQIAKENPNVHNFYKEAINRLKEGGGNKTRKTKHRHRKKSVRHRKKSLRHRKKTLMSY